MRFVGLGWVGLFWVCVAWAQVPPADADHAALRQVMQQTEAAINSGEFDRMLPVLSEQIRATPVNQEFLKSRDDVSQYFKRWFGSGGFLKKLEIKFEADALTELSPDHTWGVAYGRGVERYILSDGRPYDLKTRWTATMVKEADGQWRIRSIHIGTDFLDNPLINEAKAALMNVGGWAGGGGLVLGGLIGFWFGRKKKR